MGKILFISEEELQDIWRPSNNVLSLKSSKAITLAQDFQIKPLLGEDLYNSIATQIDDETETVATLALLELIKPALAFYAEFYVLETVSANAFNKGHLKGSADYGEASERADVERQKQSAMSYAVGYANEVTAYLCDNSKDYPLYKQESPADARRSNGFIMPSGENREAKVIQYKINDNI